MIKKYFSHVMCRTWTDKKQQTMSSSSSNPNRWVRQPYSVIQNGTGIRARYPTDPITGTGAQSTPYHPRVQSKRTRPDLPCPNGSAPPNGSDPYDVARTQETDDEFLAQTQRLESMAVEDMEALLKGEMEKRCRAICPSSVSLDDSLDLKVKSVRWAIVLKSTGQTVWNGYSVPAYFDRQVRSVAGGWATGQDQHQPPDPVLPLPHPEQLDNE